MEINPGNAFGPRDLLRLLIHGLVDIADIHKL